MKRSIVHEIFHFLFVEYDDSATINKKCYFEGKSKMQQKQIKEHYDLLKLIRV